MKKRILCIVLTLCMVLMLVPTTALAVEGKTVSFTVTADKTEAQPGDTITFTVTMGAVEKLQFLMLDLKIPEGLTYVANSGSVPEGLKETMSAEKLEFLDSHKVFTAYGCDYTSNTDTVLMTFQCKVNDDAAPGDKTVAVGLFYDDERNCVDVDVDPIAATFTPATVTVYVESGKTISFTVTADKTEAQPGDTITFTVTMGAVDGLGGLELGLSIPEGLTYVPGSGTVAEGLKEKMSAESIVFYDMPYFWIPSCNYTSTADTVLTTFQCTVNDDAALGEKAVGVCLVELSGCFDVDGKRIAATFTPATVKVYVESGKTTSFTVTADKTEAQPGDTITFTVTMGAVEKLHFLMLDLKIPEGLTYVANSGSVPEGLKETMSAGELMFEEGMKGFLANGCNYTSNTDTVLMTFQCKVNDDAAPGDKTVAVGLSYDTKDACLDVDGKRIAATFTPATVTVSAEDKVSILTVPMYRLYNPNSGEHFYTGSADERDSLEAAGWEYEGVAWNAPVSIGEPVYRMFNPNSGDHHYTMSQAEVDMLLGYGWQYENVAWNSAPQDHPDSVVQYRLYNPNADLGCHHYTGSVEEKDVLIGYGWQLEGIGWFGLTK